MPELNPEIKNQLDEYSIFFNEPLTGFKLEIKGVNQIITFFNNEIEFWNQLGKKGPIIEQYIIDFKKRIKQLQNFMESAINWNQTQITNQWNSIKNDSARIMIPEGKVILFSKTPEALFIFDLFKNEKSFAIYAHEYLINSTFSINNKDSFKGYISAFKYENQKYNEYVNRNDSEKESVKNIFNDWLQRSQDVESKFQTTINEIDKWKQKFINEFQNWESDQKNQITNFVNKGGIDLQNLEHSYTEKLKLEGPVVYWNQSASNFKRKGMIYLISLVSTSLLMIGLLLIVLYNPPGSFAENILAFKPNTIKGLLVFATIVSVGITLIRIFYKLALSSYHLQIDAEEREKLTMVYLALFEAKKVNEQERKIVLESIFSRAETGLLSGDSSPTMPGNIVNILGKTQ